MPAVREATSEAVDPGAAREVRAIARRYRMHYDVRAELHFEPDGTKRRVGFELRLWGAHDGGSRPQPGCTGCQHIHSQMERVARFVLADASRTMIWLSMPFSPTLYWAPAERVDEIVLIVRGVTADYARGLLPQDDDAVRMVRHRLESIGVCEGRWRERAAHEPGGPR